MKPAPKRKEIKLAPAQGSTYTNKKEYFESLEIVERPKGNANYITWSNDYTSDEAFQMFLVDANKNLTTFGQLHATGENGYYLTYKLERNTQYYLWIKKDQSNNLIDVYIPISK